MGAAANLLLLKMLARGAGLLNGVWTWFFGGEEASSRRQFRSGLVLGHERFMAYDRADYDYSTEEQPLPKGHAATHIGMFLAWAVFHELENEYHRQQSADALARLKRREITGAQFFALACKEQFAEKDLSPEGNAFAEHYYRDNAGERGAYFEDYRKVLAKGLPSFWQVADTWENYDKLALVITRRYEQWKNPPRKRWWQFWK